MLGAVIGDVVGSVYEFHNTRDYNFPMFSPSSNYTLIPQHYYKIFFLST